MILAGALISITLNPLAFHAVPHIGGWLSKQKWAGRLLAISDDDLRHLSGKERRKLQDNVILVGYGRVGQHFLKSATESGINVLVIDESREKVDRLRKDGITAIVADATHKEIWQESSLDKARAVVLALPEPFETRQVVDVVRDLKPTMKILVRVHSDEERDYFDQKDLKTAIMGEQEIANRMIDLLQ